MPHFNLLSDDILTPRPQMIDVLMLRRSGKKVYAVLVHRLGSFGIRSSLRAYIQLQFLMHGLKDWSIEGRGKMSM